jgi:hypothetical protein
MEEVWEQGFDTKVVVGQTASAKLWFMRTTSQLHWPLDYNVWPRNNFSHRVRACCDGTAERQAFRRKVFIRPRPLRVMLPRGSKVKRLDNLWRVWADT